MSHDTNETPNIDRFRHAFDFGGHEFFDHGQAHSGTEVQTDFTHAERVDAAAAAVPSFNAFTAYAFPLTGAQAASPYEVLGRDLTRSRALISCPQAGAGAQPKGVISPMFSALAVRDVNAVSSATFDVGSVTSPVFTNMSSLDQAGTLNWAFSEDGGATWMGIGAGIALNANAGAGNLSFPVTIPSAGLVRLTYTATVAPASGTLSVWATGKPLNTGAGAGAGSGVYVGTREQVAAGGGFLLGVGQTAEIKVQGPVFIASATPSVTQPVSVWVERGDSTSV